MKKLAELKNRTLLMVIYKTRNTRTGNGMRGIRGTRGMFTRIPGNVIIFRFRGMLKKIPGNVRKDSRECSRRFRGIFWLFIKPGIQKRGTECGERGECSIEFRGISLRIPGNVIILKFRGMFQKIPGNVEQDSGECARRFRGMFKRIPGNV